MMLRLCSSVNGVIADECRPNRIEDEEAAESTAVLSDDVVG
jgi:hypothetical protein